MRSVSILGCGWLGFPLAVRLLAAGYHVRGSRRSGEGVSELTTAGIEAFALELEPEPRTEYPNEFFRSGTLLIAIPPSRRQPDVEQAFPARIRSLEPFITEVPPEQIIFISSTSVYTSTGGVVREEDADGGETASGRGVFAAENWLRGVAGSRLTIVRFGGLIGGERHPARQLARRSVVEKGSQPVNLIGREDCLRILEQLIKVRIQGEIFNAVCDVHPTRRAFYEGEARKLGLPAPVFADDGEWPGKIVSNEKLRARLGYRFVHPDPGEILTPGED